MKLVLEYGPSERLQATRICESLTALGTPAEPRFIGDSDDAEVPVDRKGDGIFCLCCGDEGCRVPMTNRKLALTPRHVAILRVLADPEMRTAKDMAHRLQLSFASFNVYCSEIRARIGWHGGSVRDLVLWAIAHREQLGIDLPRREQFAHPKHPPLRDVAFVLTYPRQERRTAGA